MTCSPELVELFFDGELEAGKLAEVRQHLAGCAECSAVYAGLIEQRAAIKSGAPYYNAPVELRQSLRSALRREALPADSAGWRALAIAACVLLLASIAWNIVGMRSSRTDLAQIVLDDHMSSLVGDHLLDVVSSDQHTVKPWFAGKLDFSPDVRDLAQQGFPLAGARVDFIGGHRAAALVYHRRQHVITVFIVQGASPGQAELTRNGYNLLHWNEGAMSYWAVSDVSAPELRTLQAQFR